MNECYVYIQLHTHTHTHTHIHTREHVYCTYTERHILWQMPHTDIKSFQDIILTLRKTGGAMMASPSTYRTITRQRAKLSLRHFMTIFFRVSRTFWHQICDGSQVWFRSYVTLCTCTSDRKWLQNVILCTKINANLFFSRCSYMYKYAYFYSQLLQLISFWFIVLQKVSCHKFRWKKTTKTIGRKNKEIHKKFTNAIKYIRNWFWYRNFFQVQLLRMLQFTKCI